MSRDLNEVKLLGRLGKDPELKYLSTGKAVVNFTLATGRRWRDAGGEDKEETTWHNAVAWDKLAENIGQYLHKGSRVYLAGRIQNRSWDDEATGTKRYASEVLITDMIMLDPAPSRQAEPEHEDQPQRERQAKPGPQRAQPQRAAKADDDEFDLPF
jgi:single-strand DNA-binding protein